MPTGSSKEALFMGLLLAGAFCLANSEQGGLLEMLLNSRQSNSGADFRGVPEGNGSEVVGTNQADIMQSIRRALSRMRTVNVPGFYDMNKNGSSMGINVLSGLVKVERGDEAERNGLMGPRPLSVRVFGVPVFERGTRVRQPSSTSGAGGGEEEELPIES